MIPPRCIWYDYTGDGVVAFDECVDVTSGPGTILGGTITATGRNPEYDAVNIPPNVPELEQYNIEFMGARDNNDDPVISSGLPFPLATISFKCTGLGTVIIDLYDVVSHDPQWYPITTITIHGMTINQVPEPASMVILSIGGLALLRRRKKPKILNPNI
jgi:hypothetical protein